LEKVAKCILVVLAAAAMLLFLPRDMRSHEGIMIMHLIEWLHP